MTSSRTAAAVLRRVAPVAVVAALLAGLRRHHRSRHRTGPGRSPRSARHLAGRRLARDEGDGGDGECGEDGEDGEDGERVRAGPRVRRLGDARRGAEEAAARQGVRPRVPAVRDVLSLVRKDRTRRQDPRAGRDPHRDERHREPVGPDPHRPEGAEEARRGPRQHRVPSRYTWDDSNNAILAAVDRQFTNVVLVNWQKKASRHPGWLYSDGIHLTPSGRTAYARLVAKKLGR